MSRDDLQNNTTKFVADPFVIIDKSKFYLFYEQGNIRNGKWIGEIAYAVSSDGKTFINKSVVVKDRVSISFPIVFLADKGYFMTIEGAGANNVRLLKADRFPDKWTVVDTLLIGKYSDPVLLNHDELWYLFVSTDKNKKAKLFYSESMTGSYVEHPLSPIVLNDSRISRNAGNIFKINNQLYRPVQDCSNMYGEKVRLLKICALTKTTYAEKEIRSSPILSGSGFGWNKLKMHTFNIFRINKGQYSIITDGSHVNYKKTLRLKFKQFDLFSQISQKE